MSVATQRRKFAKSERGFRENLPFRTKLRNKKSGSSWSDLTQPKKKRNSITRK